MVRGSTKGPALAGQPAGANRGISTTPSSAGRRRLQAEDGQEEGKSQGPGEAIQRYLDEMDAPIRWALEGIIYAYFLHPDDILVSEDPLLLRKHQFLPKSEGRKATDVFKHADLEQSSEKAGSYFIGGFADFGNAAGQAVALGAKLGGENGEDFAAKQMAALRSTNWRMLRDEDLRLVGLKITVAREWIVLAAGRPELKETLSEESLGLLSLTRRAGLLASLADADWTSVWSFVTLGDLYYLGDRYLERYDKDPWTSPTTFALRQLAGRNDGSRLQWLGADLNSILGCSHPHLISVAPYEEYERDALLHRLAERSAEFKLYLAQDADSKGFRLQVSERLPNLSRSQFLRA